MVAVVDTDTTAAEPTRAAESTVVGEETEVAASPPQASGAGRRRGVRIAFAATAVVGLAAAMTAGWYGPRLVDQLTATSYTGASAATVAKDLGCADFKRSPTHDESVYQYHDQGSCVFDGTRVTITTFDDKADGDAFLTLMNGLIPVVHPTWVGAATAAGEGWNVADTTNLSPKIAEAAVVKLGAGEVRVIPSAKRS